MIFLIGMALGAWVVAMAVFAAVMISGRTSGSKWSGK